MTTTDQRHAEAAEFFEACWLQCQPHVYVYAAHHEFEFKTVAAHFLTLPVAGFEYGPAAFTLTVFGNMYLIPFARMSTASLLHLQQHFTDRLLEHRELLREAQQNAENSLRSLAMSRLPVDLAMEADDAKKIH